jgi:diacylglycerol kinase (ATP)
MSVLIVANVTARGFQNRKERLSELEAIAKGRAILQLTRNIRDLERVFAEAPPSRYKLIVFAGGDGTFMSGATALLRALEGRPPPVVGLAPMGTVGTTAKNFGERGAPLGLIDRWLREFAEADRPDAVRVVDRPTLRVADKSRSLDGRATRYGFIFGTGLVARFFEVYEAEGARGTALAARIVARIFGESIVGGPLAKQILTPMPCELEVDGRVHPSKGFSLLCAAVVRDLGLGMKVSYRAGERTDRIHLVASSLEPKHLGPRMPFVMMGRTIGGDGHVDDLVERFVVRFGPLGGPYVLDGDTFRTSEVEVTPGPLLPIIGPLERA